MPATSPSTVNQRARRAARRSEIQAAFANVGLSIAGPRLFGGPDADADGDRLVLGIVQALERLGPVFVEFGRYVGSRPDLLWVKRCTLLNSATPSTTRAGQIVADERVRELAVQSSADAAHERGDDAELWMSSVDQQPHESRGFFRFHYGRVSNGTDVVIKVAAYSHTDVQDDLELLPLLERPLTPLLVDAGQFAQLVADFRVDLEERLDLRKHAKALDMLQYDTRSIDEIRIPRVYHRFTSPDILVTERLKGRRLDRITQLESNDDHAGHRGAADDLARLLCTAWLRQVFDGSMMCLDMRPEHIVVLSGNEVAFVDGDFAVLPSDVKANLMDYLIAVATDEPGKALNCLLREMDTSSRSTSHEQLDRLFRQAVPFREGGWEDGGHASSLSDTLFVQWRIALQNGYRPLHHLRSFIRGTFQISATTRALAPHRDSLLEGAKDMRLIKMFKDIQTTMEPTFWFGQVDKMANLMVLGPKHLNDALSAMSDEEPRHRVASAPRERGGVGWFVALMGALLAVVFWDRHVATTAPEGDSPNQLLALLFAAVGAALLWICTSGGDGD